jgi:predicted RNA-binding protein with PUA-like domain
MPSTNKQDGDFSWVPFYGELAKAVVAKPDDLVALVQRLVARGVPMPAFEDKRTDGSRHSLAAIDPFTFFAAFNRQTKEATRLAVLAALKDDLGLSASVPTGFSGIPVLDNRNAWFFPYEAERKPRDIPSLCSIAHTAVDSGIDNISADLFAACADIGHVGVRKLTMGLFWLNPSMFLPLDRKTRALLKTNGIAGDDVADLAGYLATMAAVRSKLGADFPALSYQAHLDATAEPAIWLFQANPKHCDLVEDLKRRQPGTTDSWVVTRFQDDINRGDRVLLWQAGEEAGIYAVGTLTGAPEEQQGAHPYADGQSKRKWSSVPFVYDQILPRPILKAALQANDLTSELAILRQPAGTNFPVTNDEWEEINIMIKAGEGEEGGAGRYWKISPGRNGEEWADWQSKGIAAIGWPQLGNLSGVDRDGFDDRSQKAKDANPDLGKAGMEQVWRFSQIRPGARLVANDGTSRVLGIGTVTGLYRFVDGSDMPHQLPVSWDDTRERAVERGGWRKTLIELNKQEFDGIVAVGASESKPVVPEKAKTTLTFDGIVAQLENQGYSFPDDLVASYMLALQAKRFVILAGISGTGKTKLASIMAQTFSTRVVGSPAGAANSDGHRVHVRPYTLKHNRLWLPVDFIAEVPGLLEKASTDRRISVRYGKGNQQDVRLWRKEDANLVGLYWAGEIREWFNATFQVGDTVHLHATMGASPKDISLEIRSDKSQAPAPAARPTVEVVAVRPDWTDNRGLLGFYNPLTKAYQPTPFLNLVLAAAAEEDAARREKRDPLPFFVILDEMNLARVEHYFSDFLSCLESGDPLHLHDDQGVEEGESNDGEAVPRRLTVPRNLFFTGTVNVDETTHMFSPKVLDRAFTLEFNEVDLDGYGLAVEQDQGPPSALRLGRFDGALRLDPNPGPDDWKKFLALGDAKLVQALRDLNRILEADHRHFGYRVANEIARFIVLASDQAGREPETVWAALDVAILSKVLPKLHGTQQELEALLADLFTFAVSLATAPAVSAEHSLWIVRNGCLAPKDGTTQSELPRSGAKLLRMMRRLRQQGFTSFIE